MHKRARLPLCIFRFAFFALWAAAACSTKPSPPDLRPLRLPDSVARGAFRPGAAARRLCRPDPQHRHARHQARRSRRRVRPDGHAADGRRIPERSGVGAAERGGAVSGPAPLAILPGPRVPPEGRRAEVGGGVRAGSRAAAGRCADARLARQRACWTRASRKRPSRTSSRRWPFSRGWSPPSSASDGRRSRARTTRAPWRCSNARSLTIRRRRSFTTRSRSRTGVSATPHGRPRTCSSAARSTSSPTIRSCTSSIRLLHSALAYEVAGADALDRADWAAAADSFRKGIALAPEEPSLHHKLGTALALTGDTRGAMEQFEQALRLSPAFGKAHYSLGLIMASSGQPQQAVEHWMAAHQGGARLRGAASATRRHAEAQRTVPGIARALRTHRHVGSAVSWRRDSATQRRSSGCAAMRRRASVWRRRCATTRPRPPSPTRRPASWPLHPTTACATAGARSRSCQGLIDRGLRTPRLARDHGDGPGRGRAVQRGGHVAARRHGRGRANGGPRRRGSHGR